MHRKLLLILTSTIFSLSPFCAATASPIDPCVRLFGASGANAKAQKLTERELEKACNERACIKSIPWPKTVNRATDDLWDMKSEVLKGLREDIDVMEKKYQNDFAGKGEEAFANELVKLGLAKKLTPENFFADQEIHYISVRREGMQLSQLRLYVDYLYMKSLCKEKKYKDALAVGAAWRKQADWKLSVREGIDEAEESSYLSEPLLRSLLAGFDYVARIETVDADASERLKLVGEFLDNRQSLSFSSRLEIGAGSVEQKMLRLIDTKAFDLDLESPKVVTELSKFPNLAGMMRSNNTTTLYVSSSQMHAIQKARSGWKVLNPTEAAEGFQKYCRDTVKNRSTGNMQLFNVMKYEDGYTMDFPDGQAKVTIAEFEKLSKGEALSADHPFSKAIAKATESSLVLYANPLMLKPSQWLKDGDDFAFQISKAYPQTRVYRDPLTEKTDERAKGLTGRELASQDDVLVVVADKSFKNVEDGKVIANLAGEGGAFDKAGIKVVKFNGEAADPKWEGRKGKAVIVITGHSNEELAAYARALGKAGYLEGNYVVFNSCETPLTRQLAVEITSEFNAEAVFCYEGKILAKDVKKALGAFATDLKTITDEKRKVPLPDLLWKVLRDSPLNGVWQISFAEPRTESRYHA